MLREDEKWPCMGGTGVEIWEQHVETTVTCMELEHGKQFTFTLPNLPKVHICTIV